MVLQISVPTTPFWTQTVTIEGTPISLRGAWNEVGKFWTLDITIRATVIATGLPLNINSYVTQTCSYLIMQYIPKFGGLFCITTVPGLDLPLELDSFDTRAALLYYTQEEMSAN